MPRKPKIPPEVLADVGRRLGGRLVPVETHCSKCGNPDCPLVSDAPYWDRCPAEKGFGLPAGEPKRVELLETTPTSATVRAVFPAPNEWAVKAVRFIKGWAENMRHGAVGAERNEHGKASLFSAVGLAEHQGIDLEGSADLLDEVAAALERGDHLKLK